MKVLSYEEDSVIIPFIITRSEGNKVVFSDDKKILLGLPEDIILYGIKELKEEIEEYGYISMPDENFIININTDSTGWPVNANVIFSEKTKSRLPNPFIGFNVEYEVDTLELVEILGMTISNYNGDIIINY